MKNIFKILLLAVVFTSCSDVEPAIFNGANEGNPTLLSFDKSVYQLAIERDGEGQVVVGLNTSTLSSSDRTYTLTVLPNESESAANPATYSLPATVTIPAGEYQTSFTITGVDNNLVDSVSKNFTIQLTGLNGESMDSETVVVNVYEVCSLLADFTGTYQVTGTSDPVVGSSKFIPDGTYEVYAVGTYDRALVADPYSPAYPQGDYEVVFTLACGQTTLGEEYVTGLACGSHPEDYLGVEPTTGGAYTPGNDASFTLKVKTKSACGVAPANQTYQFTKVN